MADLATAYLLLVPSLRGAEKTIESELSGIAQPAGDKAGGLLGDTMGEGLMGKIGGIAKTAASAFGASFAAEKIFDFGKQAFDAYAEFEQLSGGIETLFGKGSDASNAIQGFAQDAYKNVQINSNDYMSTVTDFSATLLQSLDPTEAANKADKAITQMADNANKMGSSFGTVQDAYKGLAKNNATMLDNLKLGYGGTQAELARLLNDTGVLGDVVADDKNVWDVASFDQIIDAIGIVQDKIGMTGASQEEAAHTIEGSINMTKAAWENLVTEIGKPDADIGARIGDMLTAVFGGEGGGGLLANVTSEIGTIAQNMIGGLGTAIGMGVDWLIQNGPQLAQDVGNAITTNVPLILESIGGAVNGIVQWIIEKGPDIIGGIAEILPMFMQWITENGPAIIDGIGGIVSSLIQWLIETGPQLLAAAGEAFANIGRALVEHGPTILGNIAEIIGKLIGHILAAIPEILKAGADFIGGLIDGVKQNGPAIEQWFKDLPKNLLKALGDVGSFLLDAGKQIIDGFWRGLQEKWDEVTGWIGDIGGWIAEHKGPKAYDLGLLVPAGGWIMEGLQTGLEGGMPALSRTLTGIGDSIRSQVGSDLPLSVTLAQRSMDEALAGAYARTQPAALGSPRGAYSTQGSGMGDLAAALGQLRDGIDSMGIYLDGNVLVGNIVQRMDRALVM